MYTELHFHTKETSFCGTISALDSVAEYKAQGYDAIVVTDHFARNYFADYYSGALSWKEATDNWLLGYRTAKEAGEKQGIKVFLGCELSFDHYVDNDYLVYGLTEDLLYNYPELWKLSEKQFKAFAEEHGLFFAQAHPFRGWCKLCPAEHLHGIEVFNAHPRHDSSNHKAIEVWFNTDLIPICGTDYHDAGAACGCGIRFKKEASCAKDIAAMLFAREYELVIPNRYSTSLRGIK